MYVAKNLKTLYISIVSTTVVVVVVRTIIVISIISIIVSVVVIIVIIVIVAATTVIVVLFFSIVIERRGRLFVVVAATKNGFEDRQLFKHGHGQGEHVPEQIQQPKHLEQDADYGMTQDHHEQYTHA